MNAAHIEDIYPLSPLQQGLLFHSLYAPGSGVYVEQVGWTLRGRLDEPAFTRAWQRAIERHAPLRTAFLWEALDSPVQVVLRHVEVEVARHDWRGLPPDERRTRLASFLEEERRRGFEPSVPPLMRLALVRVEDAVHHFVWSHHHLLLDGWSVPPLLNEVLALYEAFREGREPVLPPVRPYRDYIGWLKQQELSGAEAYWREELRGFTAPTPLPAARSSPGEPAPGEQEPRRLERVLPSHLTGKLRHLARGHQLTLNTLVLGAWAVLLSRSTGEQDVLFGNVVSGRPAELPGVESMVGLFINTQPVRVRVRPEDRLLPWLRRLQEQQAEARQYEHTPLSRVREWSEVPREQPLFQSVLGFESYPLRRSSRQGEAPAPGGTLELEPLSSSSHTSYPLTWMVLPGQELVLRALYQPHRFEDAAIHTLLERMELLLAGMAGDPERRLASLPLMDEAEHRRLLAASRGPRTPYPRESCVHALFAEQAARTPEAVAVSYEGRRLTYGELERRANQLAWHLRRLGVGPGTPVGVCLERSPEMVLAWLGILKAGGAYVPLDPEAPGPRLGFLLEDTGAPVLLTREGLTQRLPARGPRVVRLDTDGPLLAAESEAAPAVWSSPDGTAYVMYTSGSTGTPKGVCVPHRAITRLVRDTDYITLEPSDRVAQASHPAFDAATFEVWGALLHGATLVGLTRNVLLAPRDFEAQLREERIGVLFLTTALFNHLAREVPGAFRTLKHLLMGGESVDPRWVRAVLREGPPRRLLHVYGPTESTTFATWHLVDQVPETATQVPIGRPLANTHVYLLSPDLQPVPVGIPGELFLGGDGLALGYSGGPALTAERFIPHPFATTPGERLYRTGDVGRLLPGGGIEFLGRLDGQVKLRGFRVEPAEVAAALARHPAVKEAVVGVHEGTPGDKELVAWLLPREGARPEARELRRFAQERLPAYLVPSAFVWLEALPLTPGGKVDRRALPAPDAAARLAPGGEGPRTPVEEELLPAWCEVLGRERIGIHDDFFELGGHSLKAMQLVSRVRDLFHLELPLHRLFEGPTVARMALAIEEQLLQRVEALAEDEAERHLQGEA